MYGAYWFNDNILFKFCGWWYSRTDDPRASRELLGVLGVDKLFDYMEIFPSQKYAHFKKYEKNTHFLIFVLAMLFVSSSIKKSSGIDYPDMLFFDDEYRNIRDISKLGKSCGWLVTGYMYEVMTCHY